MDIRTLRGLYALVLAIVVKKEYVFGNHVLVVPTDVVVGTAFDALGLYSIVEGTAELTRTDDDLQGKPRIANTIPFSRSKLWLMLACIAFIYTCCEVAFAIYYFFHPAEMIAPFKYAFALLKVAFCAPFLLIVYREAKRQNPPRARVASGTQR
jgi:hypothetical protein